MEIRINLLYGARDLTLDATPPVDSLRIRIITTDLQVDQTDGTTWVITGTLTEPRPVFEELIRGQGGKTSFHLDNSLFNPQPRTLDQRLLNSNLEAILGPWTASS